MIPDKIYVAESLIKTPYGNEWSPTPYISRENTEYIRKDTLMEWAKETYLNENASAIRKVCYKQIIEKIESL